MFHKLSLIPAALAAAVLMTQPAQADKPDMITVTGEISYLQRIALLPGSTATVTVSDVSLADAPAPVLAETAIPSDQVPILFTLEVPTATMTERGRYALRATIHDPAGRLSWTTDTHIPVDPKMSVNDVGTLTLIQVAAPATATEAVYSCDDRTVAARFAQETVALTVDGKTHHLKQVRSGSGARYAAEDGGLSFWDKGLTALLETSEGTVECSRAQAGLTGGTWRVEDINVAGVIDNSQTTLSFSEDGRVSGRAGCNDYTGSFTREGDKITFGPLAVTMKACLPALADQEQKFLKVLSGSVTLSFDATGALILTNENGDRLLARR